MTDSRYEEINGEDKFNRKSDMENINQIPKIAVTLEFMQKSLGKIETSLEDYPVLKTNVNWLMKVFWAIIGSTISAMAIAVVGILLNRR